VLSVSLAVTWELCYAAYIATPALGPLWIVLPWVGLGLITPVGIALGLVQTGIWYLGQRMLRPCLPLVDLDAGPGSRPRHVRAALCALAFGVVLLGATFAWRLLGRIQDDALRLYMLLYVVTLVAVAGSFFSALARQSAAELWRYVEGTRGPARPRSTSLRLLVLCLPPWVALNLLLNLYGDVLGVALLPTALLVVLAAQVPLAFSISKSAGSRARRSALVVCIASALSSPFLLDSQAPLARALGRQFIAGTSLDTLRWSTDVDRDGVSGTYGAGDCAPFDPSVSPQERDEPGNGVDEDCDGRDRRPSSAVTLLYSDTLPPHQVRAYNILWILVDTMRVDRMSVYGAKRNTTPFLDTFAESSLVFESAYAQGTTTHLSIPSMLTGRDVAALHWRRGESATRVELHPSTPSIASLLSAKGYQTHAVVGDHVHRFPSMTPGFERVVNARTALGAQESNALSLRFLGERDTTRPFFLLAYYGDPHKPYAPPRNVFGASNIDRYDAELLHVDRHIERLVEALEAVPHVWKDTVVVLSADHGEEFREHGHNGHGSNCHRETMQVPLLVRVPEVPGRRIDATVGLVDVVPTLLELTGIRPAALELSGQSLLLPASGADDDARWVSCLATKQGGSEGRPYYRIAARNAQLFVQHERISGVLEVFDVASDPGELHDVAQERSETAETAAARDFLRDRESGNLWELRLD
jgi:arylsulfatase A-like enzyme